MKVLPIIYAILFIGTCASAQNHSAAIGIDIGGLIRTGTAEISGSYGFMDNWSASWSVGIDTGGIPWKENQEYLQHLSEFEAAQEKEKPTSACRIRAQYWIRSTYEGPYLEAGIKGTKDGKAEHMLGFGYCVPVCDRIRAVISYGTGDGLSIGIHWMFEQNK